MAEGWDYYTCTVEGGPASVLLDLDARDHDPAARPLLVYVHVRLKRSRPDGLVDPGEARGLRALEDALAQGMEAAGSVYVGRLTARGSREFYFYTDRDHGIRATVRQALDGRGYGWRLGGHRDDAWAHFHQFLWPNARELQHILDRRLIKVLVRRGDPLTVPRAVRHELRLPDPAARAAFSMLVPQGWTCEGDEHVILTGTHAVDRDTLGGITERLWGQAEALGGAYLGWSTHVQRQAA